ncbi:hypothetical protein LOZ65_006925, partial [Ophidiomyces ophidiicola]
MAGEVEDLGISVDDIVDNKQELEETARRLCGEDVILDDDWKDVKQFESLPSVRAVLLRRQEPGGVVRIHSNPSRYTLTSRLSGTVVVAARDDETISVLGYPT